MRHAQLRAFHAVAVSGGFSKAAGMLNLTQPAISDHVGNLERAYGVQLFVRDARRVRLTALGRDLLALAERQFEAEEAAHELLSAARDLDHGTLIVAADAAVHAMPLLARFLARHPNVAVALKAGNSETALALLDRFEADFAVVANEPAGPGYETRILRRDRLVAFVAVDHALGARKRIRFSDLCAAGLVLREAGSVTRSMLEAEAARRGIVADMRIEAQGREAVREAVAAGLGAGIVSLSEFVADPRLHAITISDWSAEMTEWLACLKARRHLHLIAGVLDLVDRDTCAPRA